MEDKNSRIRFSWLFINLQKFSPSKILGYTVFIDCSIREYLYALGYVINFCNNTAFVTTEICVTMFLLLQILDLAVIHKADSMQLLDLL